MRRRRMTGRPDTAAVKRSHAEVLALALDLIPVAVPGLVSRAHNEVELRVGGERRRCERCRTGSGGVGGRREVFAASAGRLVDVVDDLLLRRYVVARWIP